MGTTPSRIIRGAITASVRLPNTRNGNPRYMLTIEGTDGAIERIPTRADAAWVHGIDPVEMIGKPFRFFIDDGSVTFAGTIPTRVESGSPLV